MYILVPRLIKSVYHRLGKPARNNNIVTRWIIPEAKTGNKDNWPLLEKRFMLHKIMSNVKTNIDSWGPGWNTSILRAINESIEGIRLRLIIKIQSWPDHIHRTHQHLARARTHAGHDVYLVLNQTYSYNNTSARG